MRDSRRGTPATERARGQFGCLGAAVAFRQHLHVQGQCKNAEGKAALPKVPTEAV